MLSDVVMFELTRNGTGNYPLHWAIQNSHLDCVRALVQAYPTSKQVRSAKERLALIFASLLPYQLLNGEL
jgi:ankyrin repeat protein